MPALRRSPARSVSVIVNGIVARTPSPPIRCGSASVTPSQSGTQRTRAADREDRALVVYQDIDDLSAEITDRGDS